MKRLISMLTAVCLMVSVAVPAAFAEEAVVETQPVEAGVVETQPVEEENAVTQSSVTGVEAAPAEAAPADPAADGEDAQEDETGEVDPDALQLWQQQDIQMLSGPTADGLEAEITAVQAVNEAMPMDGEGLPTFEIDLQYDAATNELYNNRKASPFNSFDGQLGDLNISVNGITLAGGLGSYAQTIYDAMAADVEKGQSGNSFQQQRFGVIALRISGIDDINVAAPFLFAAGQAAYYALDWTYPEKFYNSGSVSMSVQQNADNVYQLNILPTAMGEFQSLSTRQKVASELESKVNELVSAAQAAHGTDAEGMVRYFHDWLCENNSYNYAAAEGPDDPANANQRSAWSAAGALLNRVDSTMVNPVCEGYARAMQLLCKKAKIPCILVVGDNHMWNNLIVNDKWTGVDVTWDDQDSGTLYDFFLKDDLNGSSGHRVENVPLLKKQNGEVSTYYEFGYPVLGETDPVSAFVTRLYEKAMNRGSDVDGHGYWVQLLKSGERSGADTAGGFIFSKEFEGRGLSNEDYVEILYQTFMDRSGDAVGTANWVGKLEMGMPRELVCKGFIHSNEFTDICKNYGIDRGELTLEGPHLQNIELTAFVCRLYDKVLGRSADEIGLENWCGQILNSTGDRRQTAREVARGIVFSPEVLDKHLSDSDYITMLYNAFMDRGADANGMAYWQAKLNSGESRETVFWGFANSNEFNEIMNSFGI